MGIPFEAFRGINTMPPQGQVQTRLNAVRMPSNGVSQGQVARTNATQVEVSRDDPFRTSGQIRDVTGLGVSDEMVSQWVSEAGLKHQIAAQKTLLSVDAKARRFAFAQGLCPLDHRRPAECCFHKRSGVVSGRCTVQLSGGSAFRGKFFCFSFLS